MNALSVLKIARLKEPGRYFDGNGLHLYIDNTGARRWVFRIMTNGITHDIGLGSLRIVKLAEAREEAIRLKKIARSGGDPLQASRSGSRQIPTFEEAARAYYAEIAPTFGNEKHSKQWIVTLETYAFPVLGRRRIDTVTSSMVLEVLGPIWNQKRETASRIRQRIKAVIDYAKASEWYTAENPVEAAIKGLARDRRKKEHHAALPYSKLPAFIEEMRSFDRLGELGKLAFEFLILTATRTSETLLAKWNEIDIDARTWTITAERMKAGEAHAVPLSARCMEILTAARTMADGGEFIFPGRDEGRPMSNMVFLMALRHMGRSEFKPHGFRSTFRDWAEECTRYKKSAIEFALAHTVRDKVEGAYLRTRMFDERVSLMRDWAVFATTKPGAKVVHMAI